MLIQLSSVLFLTLALFLSTPALSKKKSNLLDLQSQISEPLRTENRKEKQPGNPTQASKGIELNGTVNNYPCDPGRSECMRQQQHRYDDGMIFLSN